MDGPEPPGYDSSFPRYKTIRSSLVLWSLGGHKHPGSIFLLTLHSEKKSKQLVGEAAVFGCPGCLGASEHVKTERKEQLLHHRRTRDASAASPLPATTAGIVVPPGPWLVTAEELTAPTLCPGRKWGLAGSSQGPARPAAPAGLPSPSFPSSHLRSVSKTCFQN